MKTKVEAHLGLVAMLAGRLAEQLPVSVDIEDLKQAGAIGLMDAVARFDPAKNPSFTTYAKLRIRGAMLDSLRELDWETREWRKIRKQIAKTVDALRSANGDLPEPEQIAQALGITLERYQQWEIAIGRGPVNASASDGIALDAPCRERNPYALMEQADAAKILAEAIRTLPAAYQTVMKLYYGQEGLTFAQIAERIDRNTARVGQIHQQAINRLASELRARGITNISDVLS